MPSPSPLEIRERNESGILTATYLLTPNPNSNPDSEPQIAILHPANKKSLAQKLLDVFLPAGYPHSDSLQAFSSSIAGLLASRAVLEVFYSTPHFQTTPSPHKLTPRSLPPGLGVGSTHTSPTSALLLSMLQESMGRIATILFAHRLGTALEPECKMYRLAADIFNDTAMVLDCLSPAFPRPVRVLVLGGSSVLRSLCGVCAGSAKASLSAHFARRGNLGELNAVSTVMAEGFEPRNGHIAVWNAVSWVSTPSATWSVLIALLSIHLATNYAAVKAVSMRSLNRQRANIVLGSVLQHGKVPSPTDVSKRERIFERDGALRWVDDSIVGYCRVGVTLEALLNSISPRHKRTGSRDLLADKISDLLDIFADEAYVLWFAVHESKALIVLKEGCTPKDQLQAWTHALLLAQTVQRQQVARENRDKDDRPSFEDGLVELRRTLEKTRGAFGAYAERLRDKGWDLDVAALETQGGTRAVFDVKKKR
ncbi:DUF647-domain-containing protein [Dothidotthia symphoricarpi CBS 119687]|uniref:DUF647-domain-containing protein n=1 Tax=Dothidotthia symphoricarpi CBS 119687 TaxID=1392245 RepID=A0A6A6A7X1_9PLEO|nr:DUF647-domain-containing protein [Dothidotthia symphoricarpi CBS 119687]KAF2127305.1 DUF647-domain-containing protein [Dothidotthia symphoricarpi CBS 119687]